VEARRLDHQDPQDLLAAPAKMEDPDNPVAQDKMPRQFNLLPLTKVAKPAPRLRTVNQDHQDHPVEMDSPEDQAKMLKAADKDHPAHQDHPAVMEIQEVMVSQAAQDNLDRSSTFPELLDPQDHQALQDNLAAQANPDPMDTQESPEAQDHQEIAARPVEMDSQAEMVNLDQLARAVVMDRATTAHLHALPQDTKRIFASSFHLSSFLAFPFVRTFIVLHYVISPKSVNFH